MEIYLWNLGGVFKWWRMMTRGGEGGKKCPKVDDVICERPLTNNLWITNMSLIMILEILSMVKNFSHVRQTVKKTWSPPQTNKNNVPLVRQVTQVLKTPTQPRTQTLFQLDLSRTSPNISNLQQTWTPGSTTGRRLGHSLNIHSVIDSLDNQLADVWFLKETVFIVRSHILMKSYFYMNY